MEGVITEERAQAITDLERRRSRMDELWRRGEVDASRYFAMRFFHGIESTVKERCSSPGPRAGYDFVKDSLHARTLARGHAHAAFLDGGQASSSPALSAPALSAPDWERLGLEIPAEALNGFARIIEGAAEAASAAAGVVALEELDSAFLRFVRLESSVRVAVDAAESERTPLAVGASLGGEPDSAHFFSFAELALAQLVEQPDSRFWSAAARGAVSAQPVYLALHFQARRRAPRTSVDYGPGDILNNPRELQRRLHAAPKVEDLASADVEELARLVGRNAHCGLIGASERSPVDRFARRSRSQALHPLRGRAFRAVGHRRGDL
ncbi:MAG: hypothetical protein AAGG01_10345 [Planctomycetota bacterium]